MEDRALSAPIDKTEVVILTARYRIKGAIALYLNARLTDYITEAKAFIAVTDADVMNLDGTAIFHASFLDVQKDHIEIIVPVDMITAGGVP